MAFDNINFTNDHDFGKYLNKFVTPSVPVTTPDQRIGRSEKLTSARRALLDIGGFVAQRFEMQSAPN
uniref:hypothetical protein n=1 Tax=uncultured Acinetobacter sp. TaxID=165433 RepID=UPI002607E714|nr:hypothetical protein [uncultured Acinetobacter sp.]